MRTRYLFSLRAKFILVLLALLLIPILGYRYLHTVEGYLRSGREAVLLERAHAATALLAEQAQFFFTRDANAAPAATHVFVRPLRTPITLDGYDEDWELYRDRAQSYAAGQVLFSQGRYRPDSLSFSLRVGSYQQDVYLLFQVRDEKIVYQNPGDASVDNGDYIELQLQDGAGQLARYLLTTSAPGWVNAQRIAPEESDEPIPEPRIKGEWQETKTGYNVELRLPQTMLGVRMAFSVNDIDDALTRVLKTTVGSASAQHPDTLSSVGVSAPHIQSLLRRITPAGTRTWVIDAQQRVLALEGGLKIDAEVQADPELDPASAPSNAANAANDAAGGLIHAVYRLLLRQPTEEFQDDLSGASQLDGPVIVAALAGQDATRWRTSADGRVSILTAATPVRMDDVVVGAVTVEETSNGILILQNRALETLINVSVVSLTLAAVVLLWFATDLASRMRRLRDSAEAAIAPDGRVRDVQIATDARDEIGDLARSFRAMLDKLTQYNRYLESMASKISHELRTPITVVRSSLDNLDAAASEEERQTYLQRARTGIERLSGILARMSEATRLEQTLHTEARVDFDLHQVIEGCLVGYRMAHPAQVFEFALPAPEPPLPLNGAPDLIAQLLDKLIANARDFCTPGTPIHVQLDAAAGYVTLKVLNQGPPLPEEMSGRLFDSMVSLRQQPCDEPHLGLGLYIVRLIAEFHSGRVAAANRTDVAGVELSVTLPLLPRTGK